MLACRVSCVVCYVSCVVCAQVHRVLKPGGAFFATTFLWGIPDQLIWAQVPEPYLNPEPLNLQRSTLNRKPPIPPEPGVALWREDLFGMPQSTGLRGVGFGQV